MNKFIEDFKTIILVILVILVINLYLCKGKEEHMTTDSSNYIPRGTIVAYNSNIAPSGWALCDGNNGTPNLNNRFILGSGSKSINTTGGAETVTLNVNQLPSHSHNVTGFTDINGAHSHTSNVRIGFGSQMRNRNNFQSLSNSDSDIQTNHAGNHTHNININSKDTGGNQAHENMPPFYVLTYIMKL
jgi:microcystin-dependent protein